MSSLGRVRAGQGGRAGANESPLRMWLLCHLSCGQNAPSYITPHIHESEYESEFVSCIECWAGGGGGAMKRESLGEEENN
jgi:hypothetical protein